MRCFLLLFILLTFCAQASEAQLCDWQWIKETSGTVSRQDQEGLAVAADQSGNAYLAGYFGDIDGVSIFITNGLDTFYNNVDSRYEKFFFAKYSSAGRPLWAKSSDVGDRSRSVAVSISTDQDNNVFLGIDFSDSILLDGTYFASTAYRYNFNSLLIKYDSAGSILWYKHISGGYRNWIRSIATDKSGNVYVTGSFDSLPITFGSYTLQPHNETIFLVKYDPAGNVIWAKEVENTVPGYGGNPILTTNGNNVYLTGIFTGDSINAGGISLHNFGTFRPEYNTTIFTAKLDSNGNAIWAKTAGDPYSGNRPWVSGIAADDKGNTYITGSSYVGDSIVLGPYTLYDHYHNNYGVSFFVAKYDTSGHVLWAKGADSPDGAFASGIATDPNGNIHICGGFRMEYGSGSGVGTVTFDSTTLTQGSGACDPFFLITYDPNGKIIHSTSLPSGGDDASSVCVDPHGNVYIGGDFYCSFLVPGTGYHQLTGDENMIVGKYSGFLINDSITKPVSCPGLSDGEVAILSRDGRSPFQYQWSPAVSTSSIASHLNTGRYNVTVTDSSGCQRSIVVDIPVIPSFSTNLGNDTTLCSGSSITLHVPTGGTYIWSNGSTDSFATYTVPIASAAIVQMTKGSCTLSDTMTIFTDSISFIRLSASKDSTCLLKNDTITLSASTNGIHPFVFVWSNGPIDSSAVISSIGITQAGIYTVTVSDSLCRQNFSKTIVVSMCDTPCLKFPNAFSPNGDGKNEIFKPVYNCPVHNFTMKIYNRWGQLVFQTADVDYGWDGSFNGIAQASGTYVWYSCSTNNENSESKCTTGTMEILR